MWWMVWLLVWGWQWMCFVVRGVSFWWGFSSPGFGRRKHLLEDDKAHYYFPKKPDWVPKEPIRMKALMPHSGCRMIADSFNRRFANNKQITVGKTYVWNTIKQHQYEIQVLRRKIKNRKPRPVPRNLIWGIDLTGKTDSTGKMHNLLGIVEHHSRANLTLTALKDKASITPLRCLLDAIEQFGKPQMIRTDNESVFTSRLFRFGL